MDNKPLPKTVNKRFVIAFRRRLMALEQQVAKLLALQESRKVKSTTQPNER
jgi:hypothetical protein